MNKECRKNHHLLLFFLTSILVFFSSYFQMAAAQPVQSNQPPIKIGSTNALTGVAAQHGQAVTLGTQIYFDRINAEGGISGRKIELIVPDNQYDPELAGKLVRQLIDKDQVLALVGLHGSAIVSVVLPVAIEKKTLLFGVWSGPDSLYKIPPERYAINVRPSYADETTAAVKGLLAIGVKPDDFAFFTQNDPSGDSIYNAAIRTLKEFGYKNAEELPHGRYTRNTLNVEAALASILEASTKSPKVVILGGLAGPNQKFFELARKEFPNTFFIFISGQIIQGKLTQKDEGYVITTEVVPSLDSNLKAVQEYREDLKKYGKGALPSTESLNTYLAARVFVAGLRQAVVQNKLTREGLIDVFENMHEVDVGAGIPISYSRFQHTALHDTWVTLYKKGEFVLTDWSELKKIVP